MLLTEQKERPIGRLGGSKTHYEVDFIKKVVQEIEAGISVRRVCFQYQLHKATVGHWLERYASAVFRQNRRCVGFTPAFKRRVAQAVQSNGMPLKEACKVYNVRTPSTIEHWIEAYNQENPELTASNKYVLSKNEENKDHTPTSQEVKALQQQLADAQLKIVALNTLIDVAEEQLKINIRKKPGAKQL